MEYRRGRITKEYRRLNCLRRHMLYKPCVQEGPPWSLVAWQEAMAQHTTNPELMALVRAIVTGDSTEAARLLAESPALANARFEVGATRQVHKPYYLEQIGRYIYA